MLNRMNRVAWTGAAAGLLVAAAVAASSCSGTGPAPGPQPDKAATTPPAPAPGTTRAVPAPPEPPKESGFAPGKTRTPPRSQLPPAPTNTAPAKKAIAPNDYVGLAQEYGGGVIVEGESSLAMQKGELVPTFKVTITNDLDRPVNHLKIRGTLKGGDIYSDEQIFTPLKDASGAAKVLAPSGGKMVVDVAFKRKPVTPEQQKALEAAQADWNFAVVELGFAN